MKLGTVVYDNKIYNLDYMTIEEVEKLLKEIERKKKMAFKEVRKMIVK